MILYLEFQARGRRGGEVYHQHLHAYLKKRFPSLQPPELAPLPDNVRSPQQQITHCFKLARESQPRLVVSDISSAARNLAAVRHILRSGGQLMLVVQARPDPAAGKTWWRRFLAGRCANYLFRNAALAVTNSAFTAGVTRTRAHAALPVVVAPPGLQIAPLAELPAIDDHPGPLRLLYVGEVSRVKGLLPLVEALGRVDTFDFHLHVIGGHTQETDCYNAVTAATARLNLRERVTFHGYAEREILNEHYRDADILVVPSLSEGYGMVIAEGFCFGLPVIASAAGAISELVTDQVNGLLVPPGDPQGLSAALARFASDLPMRRAMSAANLEKAKTLPSWDGFDRLLDEQLLPQIESLIGTAHERS